MCQWIHKQQQQQHPPLNTLCQCFFVVVVVVLNKHNDRLQPLTMRSNLVHVSELA